MPGLGASAGHLSGRHVLLTCDGVGGVWTYALDLARGLAELGATTTLAVLGPAPPSDAWREAESVPGLRLEAPGLPLDWTAETPGEVRRTAMALADLAREAGADLAHLHSPALVAGAGWGAPVIATCHSCVATWWAAVRNTPLPDDFVWRAALAAEGLGQADALIAPTRAFARETAETYRLRREPLTVHNGRPRPVSGPVSDRPVSAFTAGRLWDEGKNVRILDAAAAGLALPVRAAGPLDGPNGAAIGLAHMQSLGRLRPGEIAAELASRPIYVSPALYEPFGLAVLEAAQHGCPLVLADIPTFRELWDGAATFVDPRDAPALARALDALAGAPEERRRLGALAAARAERYGCDRFTAATVAVYRDVLARAESVGVRGAPAMLGAGS